MPPMQDAQAGCTEAKIMEKDFNKPAKQVSVDEVIGHIAQTLEWKSNFSINAQGDMDIEFENYTPQWQDLIVNITLPAGFTIDQIAVALYKYYDSYDPDEEASLWIGSDGHGKNGAPYHLKDLLQDMEDAKKMIWHLYKKFSLKVGRKKYQNVLFVKF